MSNSDENNTGLTKPRTFAEIMREENIRKEERDKIRTEKNAEIKFWKDKSEKELREIITRADYYIPKTKGYKHITEETREWRLNFFEYQSKRAQMELYERNMERVKWLLLSPNVVPIKSK